MGTELERVLADAERVRQQAAQLAENVPGQEVVPSNRTAPEVQRRNLAYSRATVTSMVEQVRTAEAAVRAEMEAKIAEMRAATAPLMKQVKQFEEAIWTVDLYLGTEEMIVPLLGGEPAPELTPLTIRQAVLSMDEETAAFAEEGGIDARNLDKFDDWIVQPHHLAQVCPEEKAVVALAPRLRGRDYGDPWMNERMAQENNWTYFLIRNGGQLWRMRTDFTVGKVLVPTAEEFTALFTERRWKGHTDGYEDVPILPGTHAWNRAMEAQGAKQRHYMRVAMILQGLVDRTVVFHPIHPAGFNLLEQATYDSDRVVIRRDAEGLLTDGRDSFYEWLAKLNNQLRPGMRVMGAFNTLEFRNAGEESSDGRTYYGNDRITPRASSSYAADKPETGRLYRLEGRRDYQGEKALFFRFERTTERWMGGSGWSGNGASLRAPKTRGSCLILPEDKFIIPFDLVTVDDMEYYLTSRVNRHAYQSMMPLLRAAIRAKHDEQETEAPFRELLVGQIAAAHGDADGPDVAELVDWWKLANKWHRPLVSGEEPEAEAKAVRMIVDEFGRRVRAEGAAGTDDQEKAAVAALLEAAPDMLVIGRTRDGSYLGFAPQPRKYPATVVDHSMWCVEYRVGKTGRGGIKTREWVVPGARMSRTTIVHTTEAWESWGAMKSPTSDLTDVELDHLIGRLVEEVPARLAAGWKRVVWQHRDGYVTDPPEPAKVIGVTTQTGASIYSTKSALTVWLLPDAPPEALTTEPLVSEPHRKGLEWTTVRVGYSKKGSNPATLDESGWYRNTKDGRNTDNVRTPWEYSGERAVVAYPDVQQLAEERGAALKAVEKESRRRSALVVMAGRSIEQAWKDRQLQAAHDKFIANYLDEALWAEHIKSLKLPQYPHHSSSGFGRGSSVPVVLDQALRVLVDRGVRLDGLTAADVMAMAVQRPEGSDLPVIDEGAVLPEDLRDLRITIDKEDS
jgi:hypothetical protein